MTTMAHILDILFKRYYDEKGMAATIGGIQTYITNLAHLAVRSGWRVRILQFTEQHVCKEIGKGIQLIGFASHQSQRTPDKLYARTTASRNDSDHYLTLFATDTQLPHQHVPHAIAIQHGICWDIDDGLQRSLIRNVASKAIDAYQRLRRLQNVDVVVCVDHHFIGWYRTQVHHICQRLVPIMNFTRIDPHLPEKQHHDDCVRIVFARRFFPYRGTRLFAKALHQLLTEQLPIEVTLAGDGPDKDWLQEQFRAYPNVRFTQYAAPDSLTFHADFDIAVVPTIGSEGTSLSLLEAMAARCAVVCTNVGGMTHIVIDGYNGLMVMPEDQALYRAIKLLVQDKAYRRSLAQRGFDTVKNAFSLEVWEEKWEKLLLEMWPKAQRETERL